MGKIIFTMAAVMLLNILPLAGKPHLIGHYKTIVLVVAAACLWLSQPAFSAKDTKANKNSDRFSIIIILIMSSASVVTSVVEWAYFSENFNLFNFYTFIGILLLAAGISIRVIAILTLGKHFTATATINSDHQLIQTGLYRYVRHPSYLGAFMAILGTPFFLNDQWAVLFVLLAMSVAYYIRISVEEKMLAAYFGDNYKRYQLKTKRIIPFIW